jgi:integrase/recombinase XerD
MSKHLLFSTVVLDFLTERKSRGRSPKTITLYTLELNYFTQFLTSKHIEYLADITPTLLREWFIQLATHRNKNGVHCSFRVIRTLLRWSTIEYDLTWNNPINKVFVEPGKNLPLEEIPLTIVQKLLNVAEQGNQPLRDKAILKMLIDTGLRGSELTALNVSDVDLTTGRVLVHYAKMGIPAIVYLGNGSLVTLKQYLKSRTLDLSPLFVSDEKTRLTFAGLRMLIMRLCTRSNERIYGVHCFRRTFALEIYRKTKDLFLVSKLLRHKKIETTIRYLNVGNEELRDNFLSASPADCLD